MHTTAYIYVVANAIRTPFQGDFLVRAFPGLKPWAVFCSPVGRLELAQENVQTPGRLNAGNIQSKGFALQGREVGGRYQGRIHLQSGTLASTYVKQRGFIPTRPTLAPLCRPTRPGSNKFAPS